MKIYIIIIIILILFIFITSYTYLEPFAETESTPKKQSTILDNINGFWYFPNEIIGPNMLSLQYYAVFYLKYIEPNFLSMTGNLHSENMEINDITDNSIDTDKLLIVYRYPVLQMTDKELNKTFTMNKIKGTPVNDPKFNNRLLGFNGTWLSRQKFERSQEVPSVTLKVLSDKIMDTGNDNYTLFTAMNNKMILLDTPDTKHQLNYYLVDDNTISISMNDATVDILKKE